MKLSQVKKRVDTYFKKVSSQEIEISFRKYIKHKKMRKTKKIKALLEQRDALYHKVSEINKKVYGEEKKQMLKIADQYVGKWFEEKMAIGKNYRKFLYVVEIDKEKEDDYYLGFKVLAVAINFNRHSFTSDTENYEIGTFDTMHRKKQLTYFDPPQNLVEALSYLNKFIKGQ